LFEPLLVLFSSHYNLINYFTVVVKLYNAFSEDVVDAIFDVTEGMIMSCGNYRRHISTFILMVEVLQSMEFLQDKLILSGDCKKW